MEATYSNMLLNTMSKMVLSVKSSNAAYHYVNIEVNLLNSGFIETCTSFLK